MKFIPLQQPNDIACGPTCIQMVANYFGKEITPSQIEHVSDYKQRDGLSNTELIDSLRSLGFQASEHARSTWEDLITQNTSTTAIIVSWMREGYMGHFSVVESVQENSITLVDPEIGDLLKLEKIQFLRLWMDYDEMWFPEKNTDIQLRWMCIVSE